MSHLDCLEEAERKAALIFIGDIRDRFEKPLQMPGKTAGKYLRPNFTSKSISIKEGASVDRKISREEVSVSWLCLPYFWLAPYSTGAPPQGSSSYPLRTLLQSRHMSTPKKRDLQQAVCGLNDPKKEYVFHVPQVWCLVLGDSKSRCNSRFQKSVLVH